MTKNKIPKGWEEVCLEDIIKKEKNSIKRGPWGSSVKKSFFVPSGYKVYQQHNIIYNDFKYGSYYINEKKFLELEEFEVKPGNFLISCSGTIGSVSQVPIGAEKGIMNQALLKISLDESKVLNDYFLYFIKSPTFQQKILTRGGAMKNIQSVNKIKKIKFILPSLEFQKRIVQKLDYIFNKFREKKKLIQELVTKNLIDLKFLDQNLNRNLSQAYLPMQIPEHWAVKKLEEIADIGQGGTPSRLKSEYWNGDIPWIRSGELLDNIIYDSREKITKKGLSESSTKLCPKNTIMIAMTGQGLTRGRTTLLGIECCANQSCAHIIKKSPDVETEFLWEFMKSRYWHIRSIYHGMGQPGINVSIIKQLEIFFPSIEEQKLIVEKIKKARTNIESPKKNIKLIFEKLQSQIKYLNSLDSSILDFPFSGKLVV